MRRNAKSVLLEPLRRFCIGCQQIMRADYRRRRRIYTLSGPIEMDLQIRRCHKKKCVMYLQRYRPEEERDYGFASLQFGIDVLNFVATQFCVGYFREPPTEQIYDGLASRGCRVGSRTVRKLVAITRELGLGTHRFMQTKTTREAPCMALSCHGSIIKHDYLDYWGRLLFVRDCVSDQILAYVSRYSRNKTRDAVCERLREDMSEALDALCKTLTIPLSSEIIICGNYIREELRNGRPVRQWADILRDLDLKMPLG